jgi:hypothetical protein
MAPKKRGGHGRKAIASEFIAHADRRRVTFNRRKKGLFKKACELSFLSGCEIAIVMFVPPASGRVGRDPPRLIQYSSEPSILATLRRCGPRRRGRARDSPPPPHSFSEHAGPPWEVHTNATIDPAATAKKAAMDAAAASGGAAAAGAAGAGAAAAAAALPRGGAGAGGPAGGPGATSAAEESSQTAGIPPAKRFAAFLDSAERMRQMNLEFDVANHGMSPSLLQLLNPSYGTPPLQATLGLPNYMDFGLNPVSVPQGDAQPPINRPEDRRRPPPLRLVPQVQHQQLLPQLPSSFGFPTPMFSVRSAMFFLR